MGPPRSFDPARWCARLADSDDFPRALTACILNKVPQEDVKVIQETFNHLVGPMGKARAGRDETEATPAILITK